MNDVRPSRPAARSAWVLRAALALLTASGLSCSEMPARPKAPVRLSGVISGRDGAPLRDVVLYFTSDDVLETEEGYPYREYAQALTNAAGAYALTLAPGRYSVQLYPRLGSLYPGARVRGLSLSPGAARFDYAYQGIEVVGRVTVPGGSPLNDGSVRARSDSVSVYGDINGGTFAFVLPAGSYRFSIRASGASSYPSIDFLGIAVASDTTLTFALDGHLVTGVVHGPDGSTMQDALVSAHGGHATAADQTAADGSYRLYLPDDRYTWKVEPGTLDRYIASRVFPGTVISAPATMDFDLSGVTLSGTVRLAGPGNPVPAATVWLSSYEPYGYATAVTDAAGAFRLIVSPYLVYSIYVSTPSRGTTQPSAVQATADSTFDIFFEPANP